MSNGSRPTYSPQGYRSCLVAAIDAGFQLAPLSERPQFAAEDKVLYLRHDIDADPDAAVRMARLEASLHVRSTYFFMTRSPVYNLFSRHVITAVRSILAEGHTLGIHFDAFGLSDSHEINNCLDQEVEFMSSVFDVDIGSVSFHQPSAAVIADELNVNGYLNAYSRADFGQAIYLSDSNRPGDFASRLEQSLQQTERSIQLLTHPMWWMYEHPMPSQVWQLVLADGLRATVGQLITTERSVDEIQLLELVRRLHDHG